MDPKIVKKMPKQIGEKFFHSNECNPETVDEEMTAEKWEHIAEDLWCILDDIDTVSDMVKPPQNDFYKYVMKQTEKRFKVMGSDGYDLFPIIKEK